MIGWGIVGYSAAYNMGREHGQFMSQTGSMAPVAFCELDKTRLQQAGRDFPGSALYESYDRLLADKRVEGVTLITPHHLHFGMAMKAVKTNRHVILEKPMCLTVREIDSLLKEAGKRGKMVTAYHNRRWDADVMAIQQAIAKGRIGEVFRVEARSSGFGHPGKTWRSDKKLSGGCFYDWGVHLVDHTLHFIDSPIEWVMAYYFKKVWDVTNEDHTEAFIRFKNGSLAHVVVSTVDSAPHEKFRVLGTKGSITGGWDKLTLHLPREKSIVDEVLPLGKSEHDRFYRSVARHLTQGKPLEVTPESARRNIAVIEAAEKSARTGKPVKPAHE